MARRDLRDARILLTGASAGIGREAARAFARAGARLLLTARRADRLEALVAELRAAGAEAWCVVGDVAEPDLRERLLAAARDRWDALDVLVNNAGVGAIGPFVRAAPDRLRRLFEVNFFAPAELTRAAWPLLRRGRRPAVLNVASVLGHRAVPNKAEYCASKFALHGWNDSLRAEAAAEGIDVLLFCPSTTATEFFDAALEQAGSLAWRRFGADSAESVGRALVRAVRIGRRETILSAGGRALVWLDRLCPGLAQYVVRRSG